MKLHLIIVTLGLLVLHSQGVAQNDDTTYISPTWSPELRVNQIESVNYPEIIIYASATYADRPMVGLRKADFRVKENGREMPVISVDARRDPISVVLLLDVSGSMKGSLTAAQDAAIAFVQTLSPNDKVEIMTFHRQIDTLYPLGNDFARAEQAIRETRPRGDTALYDGVDRALKSLKELSGRRAVIVLSDGVDDNGGGAQLSQNDVDIPIIKALQTNVPVYSVGLGNNMDEGVLRTISGATGGDYISSPTADQLLKLYKGLGKQLAGQYTIRYRSTSLASGDVREIDLDYVIPSTKPFASPKAVLKEGNIVSYQSPDFTDEQNSRLARLAGLPELQQKHNLPRFKNVKIEPNSNWPEWLPKAKRATSAGFDSDRVNGKQGFDFFSPDSEVVVINELANGFKAKGWEVKNQSTVANLASLEVAKGNQKVSIGAIREDGRTKVVCEFKGKDKPVYIEENRLDTVFFVDSRTVIVSGSFSTIRMVGKCPNLIISGMGNKIISDSVETLKVTGSDNTIDVIGALKSTALYGDRNKVSWRADANKDPQPKINDIGAKNKVTKK